MLEKNKIRISKLVIAKRLTCHIMTLVIVVFGLKLSAESSDVVLNQLTNTTGLGNGHPSIIGDGTQVVFGRAGVWRWSQDTGPVQITSPGGCAFVGETFCPSVSADGSRIVFTSNADLTPGTPGNADGNEEIFLWTEGVGFTQITNTNGPFVNGESVQNLRDRWYEVTVEGVSFPIRS